MKNEYKTKDLYISASLYALNKKFIRVETDENSNIFWFIFDDAESCEEIANRFWQKKLKLDAKIFTDAIRTLKNMIFSRGPK